MNIDVKHTHEIEFPEDIKELLEEYIKLKKSDETKEEQEYIKNNEFRFRYVTKNGTDISVPPYILYTITALAGVGIVGGLVTKIIGLTRRN